MARMKTIDTPTPDAVRAARLAAGQTQAQAAALLGVQPRTYQRWEAGDSRMPAAAWALYRLEVRRAKRAAALAAAPRADER